MAKVIYKPLGLLFSVLGGLLASRLFARVWALLGHEQEAPSSTDADRGWGEILASAALQGAMFALVKAATDRAGATGFEKVTGVWPGDRADSAESGGRG